jgi:hypothetical protein
MRNLRFLLLAPSLTGCWALSYDTSSCDIDSFSLEGEVQIGEETFSPLVDTVFVDAAESRACLTRFDATIDLGGGCVVAVNADGRSDRLDIYDANTNNLDGCGLDGPWLLDDLGDSHVRVDGEIAPSEFENTICYEGTLTIVLDLALSDGTSSVAMTGEVTLDGGAVGGTAAAACE